MEADMSLTNMALGSQDNVSPINQAMQPGDELLFVRFYIHPRQNADKTLEAGRPIFDDPEYVEIMQPGNKENIIKRPAQPDDKQRFSKQYAAFKNNEEQQVSGTPIEQWNALSKAQVEELRYFNVRTVEQLAEMSDTNSQQFAGIQSIKIQAQAYIEASEKDKTGKIAKQVEDLQKALEVSEQNNMELMKRLDSLESSQQKSTNRAKKKA